MRPAWYARLLHCDKTIFCLQAAVGEPFPRLARSEEFLQCPPLSRIGSFAANGESSRAFHLCTESRFALTHCHFRNVRSIAK